MGSLNKKKIFVILWKILETALTVIQLMQMISATPLGNYIKRVLDFLK